jgi:hypothetical protein
MFKTRIKIVKKEINSSFYTEIARKELNIKRDFYDGLMTKYNLIFFTIHLFLSFYL